MIERGYVASMQSNEELDTARNVVFGVFSRELRDRKARNPKYSLRAFARDLGVSPASLSCFLNGKSGVAIEAVNGLLAQTSLPYSLQEFLLQYAQFCSSRSTKNKRKAKESLELISRSSGAKLDLDAFEIIQDPMHFVVLECLKLASTNKSAEQIGIFLGLEPMKVIEILVRLKSVGLVAEKDSVYRPTKNATYTFPEGPKQAVRNFHRNILTMAEQSLSRPIETRTFMSLVSACSRSQRKSIGKKIEDFMKQLEYEIESSKEEKDDVCVIGFYDFSLQKEV